MLDLRKILTSVLVGLPLFGGLLSGRLEGQAGTAQEHWVATWGTAQQYYQPPQTATPQAQANPRPQTPPTPRPATAGPLAPFPVGRYRLPPGISGLDNQTVRMVARSSIGGQRVRIRLYNAVGAKNVRVGAIHLAIRGSGSAAADGSDRALTFGGESSVTLYAGQTVVSDPVTLRVPPLTDLLVSLYLPSETGPPTNHSAGLRTTYISTAGDFTGAREIADTARTSQSYYWLAGIDVLAPADAGVVIGFGDSTTDGIGSIPDSNGAWPAILAERLQANAGTKNISVVNAGIGANRLLGDNVSGIVRMMAHALSVPGVKWIALLEGVNDIAATPQPGQTGAATAGELIAGYKQFIELAHLHGVKVIGCTIMPYGGSRAYNDAGEAVRQTVNGWIRSGGAFDAMVDLDAATRDPREPTRLRPETDTYDLIHPDNAGYRLMANAFDLSLFASPSANARARR
jgi:lysophospholipase L1-like esterase